MTEQGERLALFDQINDSDDSIVSLGCSGH